MDTQGIKNRHLDMMICLGLLVALTATLTCFVGAARADTGVTLPLSQVGQGMWVGNASNARLGDAMQPAGDVNGDGVIDLVSSQRGSGSGSTSRGIWVLFTRPHANGPRDLSDLPPSEGYRMRVTNSTSTVFGFAVGDQNGDGTPDFVVRRSSDVYLVYGVSDPAAELPKCDALGTSETRCLDLPAMTNLSGDRLGYMISSGQTSDGFAQMFTHGDFDGDGTDELVIGAYGTDIIDPDRGAIYVARHNLGDLCPAMPDPCSFDFSGMGADDVVRIDGPVGGGFFGNELGAAGDLNDDGRDDLLVGVAASGAILPSVYAVYGQDWASSPVGTETFGPDQGFTYVGALGTLVQVPASAGDANGDGRPDVAVIGVNLLFPDGPRLSIAYTLPETPSSALPLMPPNLGQGYLVDPTPDDSVGNNAITTGDFNSDGFDDLSVADSGATALGVLGAGSATILFGAGPQPPADPLIMGSSITADHGFSLVGDAGLQSVGGGVAPMGDIDDDGIPDVAVASTDANGQIFLVRGRSLFGDAVTGQYGNVQHDSATVAGVVNAHGRPSEAYFEYGATDSYGEKTEPQEIGQSNKNQAVDVDLAGLSPETELHYRAVVENDVGLKSFGRDRTFKTAAKPVERCEADPKAPGCPDYKYCEDKPEDPICQSEPDVARLSNLIVGQKKVRVRRGKSTKVRVTIVNTGNASARGIRICAAGPRRFVAIQKCRRIGNLAAGRTASRTIKVRVKRRTRRSKRIALRLTASAGPLGKRTATVNVRIR